MYVAFCKIDHCIHIHWCIVMGLGHNDPWVESHMWPQQTWGQRSSKGQWPLVQVFGKKGQCIHILWCIFKSNITMIAKNIWSRKQARLVVQEPPCFYVYGLFINYLFKSGLTFPNLRYIHGKEKKKNLEIYSGRVFRHVFFYSLVYFKVRTIRSIKHTLWSHQ